MLFRPFLLLLVLAWVPVGGAQADADGAALTPPSQRGFEVAITGPAPTALAYGDPVVLTVKITPRQMFERSDMALKPLGDLAEIYGPPEEGATCVVDGTSRATVNVMFMATCQLRPKAGRRFWRPTTWFVPPGVQRLALEIPIVEESGPVNYYEEVPVPFKAPLDAIFIGGLTGALLLAIFTAVKGRAEAPIPEVKIESWQGVWIALGSLGAWGLGLAPRVWRLFLQTVMGGICALILILLAQGTEGMSPPISIRIQDFWGGVVVGLLSIPLSRWLWTQVQPKD